MQPSGLESSVQKQESLHAQGASAALSGRCRDLLLLVWHDMDKFQISIKQGDALHWTFEAHDVLSPSLEWLMSAHHEKSIWHIS